MPSTTEDPPISLDVRDAPITDVIALLAKQSGANVVADQSVRRQRVTLRLSGVRFLEALRILAAAHGLQVQRRDGVLIVGSADAMNRIGAEDGDPSGTSTVVLALRRAAPEDVSKDLLSILPSGAIVVPDQRTGTILLTADARTIAQARHVVEVLDASPQQVANQRQTRAYVLRFTRAQDVVKELKGALSDGVFVADDAQNAVLVTGADEAQQAAARAIQEIDVAGPQVLFEVRVADITPANDQSDVGLEFGGIDLHGQPLPGAATYAFASGTISVNVRLNALITNGHAQILATPRLVTLNGREADLLIGETYPIVYNTSVLGGQNVQFVDIGVKLRLTPIIGPDGSVTAELHPEYSELQGFTSSGYPIIANRKIDSTLRVRNGQTIVLGGLIRDVSSDTIERVPWLSQIPILGKIFQDRQSSHERDEIVFLITPHVIDPNAVPTR
ncbi:MAG TPA: secretin N-terminal domain-containing protein [Candidatus Tyrphobacter sp.]